MGNESDKLLRDKLKGIEPPFDPSAWEQMEAMMDKKQKRRIIGWWWFGAAALLLSIGAGVAYEYGKIVGSKQLAVSNSKFALDSLQLAKEKEESAVAIPKHQEQLAKEKNESTVNSGALENAKEELTVGSEQLANKKNSNNNLGGSSSEVEHSGNVPDKKNAVKSSTISGKKENNSTKQSKQTLAENNNGGVANSKKKLKSNNNSSASQTINNKPQTTNNAEQTNGKQQTTNPSALEEVVAMETAAKKNADEPNMLDIRRPDYLLVKLNDKLSAEGVDGEVADLKRKNKIFNYSIGVSANVTATTLGKQINQYEDQMPQFHKTPSYMAGLTHEFLFVKRFAITNSLMFSQTSFKVHHPNTITFMQGPLNYTASVTELAIPIGIKVYPVSKPNLRFYLHTGIINHIILKEKFSYTQAPRDSSFLPSTGVFDTFESLPETTDFKGAGTGLQYDAANLNAAPTTSAANTNDFSISNAKRYYMSFYAGAGVEAVIKKKLVIFAEPMFFMGIKNIGVQEKRKYNIGATAGLRVEF